jgi:alpha-glucosidase
MNIMSPLASASWWWKQAAGYEIYVPSFADGNGDGLGDLRGICERLGYLAWLGIDLIWLTPFYLSPLADHGYDVADHCRIDPRFGDTAAFDAVICEAHRLGLRVLIDFVANHTSCEHPWFRAARSSRSSAHRDWYIWRDPAPGGGPPNNWASAFGGSAWAVDPATGQWYLHLHLPEQPDLNWSTPGVAAAFDRVLEFWLDRGVDGFRIDVAHELVKHPSLPDNPPRAAVPGALREPGTVPDWERLEHRYDLDQPGVLDIHRRWRRIADRYGALLLGEVYLLHAGKLGRYLLPGDGLHAAFWVQPLALGWDPLALAGSLRQGLAATPPGSLAWVQGNHDDQSRAATRFGGGEQGRRRSLAFWTLTAPLPGMAFSYQGEELGLTDSQIPPGQLQDPLAVRNQAPGLGRDRVRTPMPWQPGPGHGFTSAPRPWLPDPGRADADTVAVQRSDPSSFLHRFRDLLHLRRDLRPADDAPVHWLDLGSPLTGYRRPGILVVLNGGHEDATLQVPQLATVVYSSAGPSKIIPITHDAAGHTALTLTPDETVIIRTDDSDATMPPSAAPAAECGT